MNVNAGNLTGAVITDAKQNKKKGITRCMQRTLIILFIITGFKPGTQAQNRYVDSLIEWTVSHPQIDSLYILTLHRISYRLSEKNVKASFSYYEKVVSLSDSLNFTFGKALAQVNLGILLSSSANFHASNKAYFQAIDYAEACGALRLKAVSLNNAGENLKTLKDFARCRHYTREAIEINTKLKAWRGVAINYELLQQCDLEENLFSDAKKNLLQGMSFALKENDSYIQSQLLVGFGKLHAINKHYDSAAWYFAKAMQEAKLQNDLRNVFQVYLAEAHYLKTIPAAKKSIALDSALILARQTDYLEGVSKAASELSAMYNERGNKDSSLFFYRIYRSASDSLFSENNKRNVIIRESEWMIRRKEIENVHLKELATFQNKQINIKNGLLLAVLTCLVLVIAIAFFIYKNNRTEKRRTESSLKQKIAEIQMQVLRAQMNPHFIFNSLNSIENFMMQNEKRLASDYLNKFTRLIRTILDSSLNELLPVAKDMEALQLYIDLQLLRFNNKFIYQTTIDPQLLTGDYKAPALIIQPFVENAIEHGIAHSERIDCKLTVRSVLQDEHIIYMIEDNGIGRQQAAAYNEQNKRNHKSVGIAITADRIRQFNGENSSDDDIVITDLYDADNKPAGTSVTVKIKLL